MSNQNKKTIKDVFWNEVTVGLTIGSAIIGAVLFITGPDAQMRQDIALIQDDIVDIETNSLKHIEADMAEIKKDSEENQKDIQEIKESLARIETILGE